MEYSATTTTATALILILAMLNAGSNVMVKGEDKDVEVVKGPNCGQNSTSDDSGFEFTMPILLSKLVVETPKHADNSTGGHTYSGKSDFGPKGEGKASCKEGKDKTQCGVCLADAMARLADHCRGKSSGTVELKACQMSFQQD